ncbi:MAG: TrkH family potassium uptake protein [Myxococcota bacterium]
MNIRAVLFVLGNLLLLLAGCLVAPLAVAVIYPSDVSNGIAGVGEVWAFLITMTVALGFGFAGRILFRRSAHDVRVREGFAVVTFSWLAMVAVGALPYLLTGVTGSLTDAYFETMSGFTTTGATIFPRVEVIPHGVQFWRCMTQWLGGMGIVVLSVALLPMLGAGGYRMLKAETPGGVAFERERPRITDTAKQLWALYLTISAVQVVLLRVSGMTWFDAFCHAFTTMSTGGFSPHTESIAFFDSPMIQWIIIVFMFAAGVNFSLYAMLLRGQPRRVVGNHELRLYVTIMVACVLVGVFVLPSDAELEKHIRDVIFQVVSIGTTTGYVTADYDRWGPLMGLMLVALMFVGGCMGSTGGGMKVARLLVFFKALIRELHRPIFPHAVRPIRIADKVIEPKLVANILAFGMIYVATFVAGALVMAAFGYDIVTAISASAAALGNIGPGLARVGPSQNWAHLPDVVKWVMIALMLLGRLELYSVLILITPWAWRR